MNFSDDVKKELAKKLDPSRVKSRKGFDNGGESLQYVEGWDIIDEANQVFGYDAWSRRIVSLEFLGLHTYKNKTGQEKVKCGYRCTIEVSVNGVVRCGTGFGNSIGNDPIDIHELAVKEAETDAMKRAFATFGYRFGLALYDKSREFVGIDTTDEDEAREKLKQLIVDAMPEQQAWFSEKYGAVNKVPITMLDKLIARLELSKTQVQ